MLNGDEASTQRTLTARGRLPEIPHELVLDKDDDGYRIVGSRSEAASIDRCSQIRLILAAAEGAMTPEQVRAEWPEGEKIGIRTLRGEMSKGFEDGLWHRAGSGVKGDGFEYFIKAKFDSGKRFPMGGQESESEGAAAISIARGGAESQGVAY